MVNVLHREICENDSFGISEVVTLTRDKKEDEQHRKPPKKFEDVKLQALLDEDDSQTQEQLPEQWGVNQRTVSNRPREMGKIQKNGRTCSSTRVELQANGKS